jgi:hypothetical protein
VRLAAAKAGVANIYDVRFMVNTNVNVRGRMQLLRVARESGLVVEAVDASPHTPVTAFDDDRTVNAALSLQLGRDSLSAVVIEKIREGSQDIWAASSVSLGELSVLRCLLKTNRDLASLFESQRQFSSGLPAKIIFDKTLAAIGSVLPPMNAAKAHDDGSEDEVGQAAATVKGTDGEVVTISRTEVSRCLQGLLSAARRLVREVVATAKKADRNLRIWTYEVVGRGGRHLHSSISEVVEEQLRDLMPLSARSGRKLGRTAAEEAASLKDGADDLALLATIRRAAALSHRNGSRGIDRFRLANIRLVLGKQTESVDHTGPVLDLTSEDSEYFYTGPLFKVDIAKPVVLYEEDTSQPGGGHLVFAFSAVLEKCKKVTQTKVKRPSGEVVGLDLVQVRLSVIRGVVQLEGPCSISYTDAVPAE